MLDPYVHQRRIGFGDCDPARIFFAPRAFDFAVEAVEACFRDALGAPWDGLIGQGLALRIRAASCEYRRSAAASQVLRLRVEPAAVDSGDATLAVEGAVDGAAVFEALIGVGLVEAATGHATALPAPLRQKLGALPRSARPEPPRAVEAARPDARLAGAALFTRRRRIRHGECGPDGLAYAPRLLDLAVEAVGEWYEEVLGLSWIAQCRRNLGTPFVSIRATFPGPLRAGEEVGLAVRATRLGRASIGYRVTLVGPAGAPRLEADLAACHITEESGAPVPRPFPEDLRARIEAHMGACAAAGGAAE